ncbi:MAG: hypothetical protein NTZ49_02460 [Candidatus Parcubacteria bacterium]|nr:hypothetical protein [Candidatus Parcubacteria bacterium]
MNNYNWQVVGHSKIQQYLQKSLNNNKLAHAYLFSGLEHLGRSLVGQKLISSILCQDFHQQNKLPLQSSPCGQCAFCQQAKKNIHPDIYILKKEEDKKNISVEQVREMHKFLNLTSFLNSYKFALVENAQDLSESAQNALLKILEEPGPKTILILITTDSNLILPTIASRCQLIKFQPLAADEIFHHLVSLGSSRSQAEKFTALARGQIGLAISYFQHPDFFDEYLEQMDRLVSLFDQDLVSRFKNIEQVFAQTKNPKESANILAGELDNWQLILHDLLAARQNLDNLIINLHYLPQLKKVSLRYDFNKLLDLFAQVNLLKKYLTYNINPRLAAENLLINL